MKNKLSYLGVLGLLGFAGFFGEPLLFCFFANFTFFSYIRVVPDELFWNNVRACATRGFFIFYVLSNCLVVISLLLSVNSSAFAAKFIITGFALVMVLCELMFLLNLEYLERKERKCIDEN